MSRQLPFLCYFSLVILSYFHGIVSSSSSISRQPMIIPLHLTSPNISNHRASFNGDSGRRHLQNSEVPTAHMRLYDELLTNGYYTTRLFIGTPPQEFALIVDTGSTVTYVPCSSCEHCGKHQDPRFQPELSSTYQAVKCNPSCNCDDEAKQCTYERRYAEMSSSSGVIADDILSFGNESDLAPQRAVFGCENAETGDLFTQRADGIMGLGRGRLSIVDQLVEKDVISDYFSLCYGGMDVGGGAMVLGGISPPSDMVFSHSNPYRSPYYNIELKELHVAGKPLKLDPKVFDGKHGTVLDSGTTYAYLPYAAFTAFKDSIKKEVHFLKQIPGPDPNYHDICYAGAGREVSQLSKIFPGVNMVFGNGQKLSLSPENYLFRHTKVSGAYCFGIFPNGNDPTTLLGGIVVRNTLVTYDRENDKIGFWKTNCSELWKRLQVPATPIPPQLAPDSGNRSAEIPSNQSLTGLPSDPVPGGLQIGVITFDMLININSSAMKPNLTEIVEFIAHSLEVDNLRVHMLNFTFQGSNYLIKWAIIPVDSTEYISNTTAMDIIQRLREHQMEFPNRFGSYQLVEWNVGPQRKQTWLHQHSWAIGVGMLITLVFCLSGIGVWLGLRHKLKAFGTYEPVNSAAVSEQELQPL